MGPKHPVNGASTDWLIRLIRVKHHEQRNTLAKNHERARGSERVGMKKELKSVFKSFSIELPVYAVLVIAYFFLVLHFLGGWLYDLFRQERRTYAIISLLLIVGQGIVLEILTRALLGLVRRRGGG
jgi:hypothetical protein